MNDGCHNRRYTRAIALAENFECNTRMTVNMLGDVRRMSMLGASSYNFENKGKYYLYSQSIEGQWLIVKCVKNIFVRVFFLF